MSGSPQSQPGKQPVGFSHEPDKLFIIGAIDIFSDRLERRKKAGVHLEVEKFRFPKLQRVADAAHVASFQLKYISVAKTGIGEIMRGKFRYEQNPSGDNPEFSTVDSIKVFPLFHGDKHTEIAGRGVEPCGCLPNLMFKTKREKRQI